jgi:hypothetical protein
MTTTNHTSPIGEDAANGAIGEREAFEAWGNETFNYGFQPETWCDGSGPVAREAQYTHEGTQMAWDGWKARAALHAEKVTAEPVDFVFPPMPPAIVMHDKLGPLFDRLSMHFYAYKCMTIAAPQQPAQSGEQDEPYGYAPANPNGNYFTRNKSTADYVGGMMPVYARAATQSTATQPAQTQVALTQLLADCVQIIKENRKRIGYEPGSPNDRTVREAIAILAAQSASGADHD